MLCSNTSGHVDVILHQMRENEAKHRHSRSLGCRRLMATEASWGVCRCEHQALFSMQINMFQEIWRRQWAKNALETGQTTPMSRICATYFRVADLTASSVKLNDIFVCFRKSFKWRRCWIIPKCSADASPEKKKKKKNWKKLESHSKVNFTMNAGTKF